MDEGIGDEQPSLMDASMQTVCMNVLGYCRSLGPDLLSTMTPAPASLKLLTQYLSSTVSHLSHSLRLTRATDSTPVPIHTMGMS